jgi:hypothetical protein
MRREADSPLSSSPVFTFTKDFFKLQLEIPFWVVWNPMEQDIGLGFRLAANGHIFNLPNS